MEFTQNFMITSGVDPVYHSVSFKEYGMYTIEVNPFQKTVGGRNSACNQLVPGKG